MRNVKKNVPAVPELEAAEAARLGARIRELRQAQQMTLEELAERSGVSRAMISKVERGTNNPTLVVAVKIASGLGVGLTDLLSRPQPRQARLHLPRAQQPTFRDEENGFVRHLLSPTFEERDLEFTRHELPAKATTGELPASRHGARKYMAVERGTLHVVLPDERIVLAPGDACYFEPDMTHEFVNAGNGACVYYVVGVPASRR